MVGTLCVVLQPFLLNAQDGATPERRAREILEELQTLKLFVADNTSWVRLTKELIELGPEATLPICEALKRTDDSTFMRVCGFALRAIDDPRAVPTLIETIPKTLGAGSSDLGLAVADESLNKFMHQHDISDGDTGESFILGLPRREVIHAIEKLVNHQFDDSRVVSIRLGGSPLHRYLHKQAYHEFAVQLKTWWEQNYDAAGADLEFVDVELAEFLLEKPQLENVFENESAEASLHTVGMVVTPPSKEKNYTCFYDLDRGIQSGLPLDYDQDVTDLEAAEKWGIQHHFYLMGMQIEMDGFDEPQFVIKPLGLKFWQINHRTVLEFGTSLDPGKFDFSKPGSNHLAFYDESEKQYYPDRKATFLYQTSEGTFGAIELVAQVTNVRTLDQLRGRRSSEVADNEGLRPGVKIGMLVLQ